MSIHLIEIETMSEFTPVPALIGGALIGLSAGLLWLFNGRTAGISSILGEALAPRGEGGAWRWTFLAGLIAGGLVLLVTEPGVFGAAPNSLVLLAGAGFLVGIGTRLAGGCTSGHGVCGLARLSGRSLIGVATFMALGGVTVFLVRHILQGGL